MSEFAIALLYLLPPYTYGEHCVQHMVMSYNRTVTDPTKYVYHIGRYGELYLYDQDLPTDKLSFEGFDWKNYRTSEVTILQPQLEALGFHVNHWTMGESDSWGPLSRCASLTSPTNQQVTFVYG